jgi:hypothetical protein
VRVLAAFDDLLLGSNVLGMLRAAGHEAELTAPADARPGGHDVVIVDLSSADGLAIAERAEGAKLIGVYSHVDVETKQRAEAAGFDLVVPRSRMAREGPSLVARFGGD